MLRRMDDKASIERRQAVRIPVAIPMELRGERGFSLYGTRTISLGGAFFDRAIPHDVGARLEVAFTLPGDEEQVVCAGEVVNVPDRGGFGMGVRFLDLRPEDKRRLESFVERMRGEAP